MTSYSLVEYKLRRYLYLGHEYSLYVPPPIKNSLLKERNQDHMTGVRIIGKIVKKNDTEQIKSIVPILLKIKKEDKIHDDRLLIFALAVCTGFDLKQCTIMASDAFRALQTICTDGLKLLMFVKFYQTAISIIYNEGYVPNKRKGFSNAFRKAVTEWYLDRDPLLTTEQIVRHKSYDGLSHKSVIKLLHIHSDNPCRNIFIIHTIHGMDKVENMFGLKVKDVRIDNINETFENKQLKFIYNHLKQINDFYKMDENTLQNEIELCRWGHNYEVIPKHMLQSSKILTSLVKHMPLRALLDKTFFFAKQRLFCNSTPHDGLWEFILRFNNSILVKKSRIHPIESFIEYAKYSRTVLNIVKLQNCKSKELDSTVDNKLKVFLEIKTDKNIENSNSQAKDTNSNVPLEKDEKVALESTSMTKPNTNKNQKDNKCQETNILEKDVKKQNNFVTNIVLDKTQPDHDTDQIQAQNYMTLLKPLPKLVDQLLSFLSEDLIRKTLDHLIPSGLRILIAYDNRMYLKEKKCLYMNLINIHEAITLIILSLIYPEKLPNKPTVCGLDDPGKPYDEIEIDYSQPLTVASLNSILYKTSVNNDLDLNKTNIPNISPLSTMDWAKENKKEYDVFVFLGSNKMNLRNIKKVKKEYQAFSQKSVKIIICCLNGKHVEQSNANRQNMLFTVGFDKNIGKMIGSFINGEF